MTCTVNSDVRREFWAPLHRNYTTKKQKTLDRYQEPPIMLVFLQELYLRTHESGVPVVYFSVLWCTRVKFIRTHFFCTVKSVVLITDLAAGSIPNSSK